MSAKRFFLGSWCILLGMFLFPSAPILAQPPQDPIRIKNIPALIDYVKSSNQYNRKQALLKLQVLGSEAKSVVPTLAETLSDPDEDIRALAFDALRSMEADAAPALPTLIKIIEGNVADDRRHAIEVLSKMGPAAKAALPALRKAAQDEDFMVSDDAKEVLELLGEKTDHDSLDVVGDSTDPTSKTESGKPSAESNSRSKPQASVIPPEHKDLNSALSAKMDKTKDGWIAMHHGDQVAAIKIFDEALQLTPHTADTSVAYAGRGMCHVISRDFVKAEEDFNKALALIPLQHYWTIKSPNMEALVNIVYNGLLISHLNEDKLVAAISDQRAMAKYNPGKSIETHNFCGTLYGILGRFSEGIKEFDAVLKKDPHNEAALKSKELFKESLLSETLASETKKVLRNVLEERIAAGNANLTAGKLSAFTHREEAEAKHQKDSGLHTEAGASHKPPHQK